MASSLSALPPGLAAAQALPPECSLTGPGSLVTCKYFYTGHSQRFTVPEGVTYLFVVDPKADIRRPLGFISVHDILRAGLS